MDRLIVVGMWLVMAVFWGGLLWALLSISRSVIKISDTLEDLKDVLAARSDVEPATDSGVEP
jgi:hypothetical protein